MSEVNATVDVVLNSLEAIGSRVVVDVWPAETVTARGIVLPENVQEKPQIGTVVSAGERVKARVVRGDVVIFANYAGTEMELPMPDGSKKTLLVLDETDIMCKWVGVTQRVERLREEAVVA